MIVNTTGSLGQFLEGVRAKFFEVFDQGQAQVDHFDMAKLFGADDHISPLIERINASGRQKLEATGVTGMSSYLQPTGEGQPFIEASYFPTYVTAVQPFKFTQRIRVTQEAIERTDKDYRRALDETGKLKGSAAMTMSKHTIDFFNFSRTAQTSLPQQLFGYGDAQKFGSTTHADKIGNNQSNILSTSPAISVDTVESMILQGYNTKDDAGRPMPYLAGPKWMIGAPATQRKLQEIAQTPNTPYTANFIANIFQGIYMVLTSPFLSTANGGKDTRVFMVDGNYSPIKQVVFKDVTLDDHFDFNNKTYLYDVEAQWKVGPFDWRGSYQTEGDNSTISD